MAKKQTRTGSRSRSASKGKGAKTATDRLKDYAKAMVDVLQQALGRRVIGIQTEEKLSKDFAGAVLKILADEREAIKEIVKEQTKEQGRAQAQEVLNAIKQRQTDDEYELWEMTQSPNR